MALTDNIDLLLAHEPKDQRRYLHNKREVGRKCDKSDVIEGHLIVVVIIVILILLFAPPEIDPSCVFLQHIKYAAESKRNS